MCLVSIESEPFGCCTRLYVCILFVVCRPPPDGCLCVYYLPLLSHTLFCRATYASVNSKHSIRKSQIMFYLAKHICSHSHPKRHNTSKCFELLSMCPFTATVVMCSMIVAHSQKHFIIGIITAYSVHRLRANRYST